jgi:hypothetical protein
MRVRKTKVALAGSKKSTRPHSPTSYLVDPIFFEKKANKPNCRPLVALSTNKQVKSDLQLKF